MLSIALLLSVDLCRPATAATITGQVSHDLNGNGVLDTADELGASADHAEGYLGTVGVVETGIKRVTVTLSGQSATIDAEGYYTLTGVSDGSHQMAVSHADYD